MSTMTNSQVKADEREKKDLELAAETYVELNWGNDAFKNEVIAGINSSEKVYCLPLSKIADSNTDNKFVMLQKVNGNSSTYRFSFTYVDKSASTDPNKDKC